MASNKARRAIPPLDRKRLDELALRYVGRYATTRAKLRTYLARKLRERGWSEAGAPDLEALGERFADRGEVGEAPRKLVEGRCRAWRGKPGFH